MPTGSGRCRPCRWALVPLGFPAQRGVAQERDLFIRDAQTVVDLGCVNDRAARYRLLRMDHLASRSSLRPESWRVRPGI